VLVLKVYGRFAPSQHERDKWERIAAAADRALEIGVYQPVYQSAKAGNEKSPKRMRLNDFDHSRGGTRTRDPGIMSAVL
jgi:hypothetical protein